MSTVTPTIIDPGDAYTASSVNTAIQGLSDGYNALEDDDLQREGFGIDVTHPVVTPDIATNVYTNNATPGTVTGTFNVAYPGATTQTGWDKVILTGPINVMLDIAVPFEVGPTSASKVAAVLVGATFDATVPNPQDEGHIAFGIKHTGNANVLAIMATDFWVSHNDTWCAEFLITEDDVPVGEDLEEIWLLASGPQTVTVDNGQLWAIPIHSGS
jgi:hypothetical protein